MKTIYELQQIANRLRQATEANSISPEDTFGLQSDVLEYLADMEQNAEGLGIHKVYASYAAMVADASAPVGSNGKALRFGQLVVIYNSANTSQAESGNVYAWQKGNSGAAAWLLMGNLGSVLGNPQNGYYVCDTAAATAEKEISATGYVLSVGGSMKVKMTNANTVDNATLNINSTGVKPLFYDGERASANNSWEAGETVEVYYDGTSYYANSVAGGSGSGDGAFDVSAKYPTSGVDGGNTYTLDGALAVLNANLSANKKKGGMSIKFIQSSDNKYVQYRLMADEWSTSTFDWERYNDVTTSNQPVSDLNFSDEQGNVLVMFKNGHIKTKNFDSSKNVITDDDENADLNFSDEQGNVLAAFSGGHIKTKLFNSRYTINYLEKFKGKSIGIIGDSISTYEGWLPSYIQGYDGATYATYYPKGNVDNVQLTWWHKLATMLGIDETRISNCAWSGSKVTGNSLTTDTAAAGCSDRRIADLAARGFVPDIIICFISANDWAHNISIGTWKPSDGIPTGGILSTLMEAYATMLNKLHVNYPLSRIFVCTILDDYRRDGDSLWPSNNGNGISTYEWNENIVELADAFGCEIIDFNKCGINYQNIATYYAVDAGLHPNAAGMNLLAQKAFKEIITKY